MGPDVAENVDVDELVRRFTAWQLYSKVFSEPEKVKAAVLSASAAKKASSTSIPVGFLVHSAKSLGMATRIAPS